MAKIPGGQERQKPTCTAQAGTGGSLFWQRRGKDVAELSFSLKTCRPKIVGEEENRRQTPTITSIVLLGQSASDDENNTGRSRFIVGNKVYKSF